MVTGNENKDELVHTPDHKQTCTHIANMYFYADPYTTC